jgi:hypothetical protein
MKKSYVLFIIIVLLLFSSTAFSQTSATESDKGPGLSYAENHSADNTLAIGDIITMRNTDWYYYYIGGGREVIPAKSYSAQYHDAIMKSYGWEEKDVKIISQDKLESIPLIRNLTIKPGTFLLKREGNHTEIYEIKTEGLHVLKENEAASLYGPKWKGKIVICPEIFWTNYQILE